MTRSNDRYAELFVTHRVAVLALATLLAGNRHVGEEIAAEVFARALPHWRRGDVREPLQYLRRAVVNEVRSRHRRRGHEERALARTGLDTDESRPKTDRVRTCKPCSRCFKERAWNPQSK